MRSVVGVGVLSVSAVVACGRHEARFDVVVSADSAFSLTSSFPESHVDDATRSRAIAMSERQFNVVVNASSYDADSGREYYELDVDGKSLSVVLEGGTVTRLLHDEENVGGSMPKLNLCGNSEWVALSQVYNSKAVKLLSFVEFLGLSHPVARKNILVVGRNVAPQTFAFLCGKSKRFRQIEYNASGHVRRIYESRSDQNDDSMKFSSGNVGSGSEGWKTVFSATMHEDTGFIKSFVCNEFSARYNRSGGLVALTLFDPITHRGVRERKWNAFGTLAFDRDLLKNPYPSLDITNAVIRK